MSVRLGFAIILSLSYLLLASPVGGRDVGAIRLEHGRLADRDPVRMGAGVKCMLSYYYLVDECPYVTVLEDIQPNETFGMHFNMMDSVYWYAPCDTAACLTLDVIDLIFYDVLAPPTDQSMNIKVIGADPDGEPSGDLLGNRDFEPSYTEPGGFTSVEIDFTNGGVEPGLDLSGCGGNFIVLLTWKNPSGHPGLVLDNIGTCVDSCAVESACCEMGLHPYLYPRTIHTYCYGTEWAWSKQDSICDLGGCGTFGCLEALWTCGFCTKSSATEATRWGGIKARYK
jgi:hypothetical protein